MRPVLILALIIFGLIAAFSGCNTYNNFVDRDVEVENKWADVQSEYQRRADLIPNLVNTVKGAADFEQSTIAAVTEARAKATSIQIDPSNITPEQLQQFQAAQGELSSALGRLLMVTENYPELKATEAFRDLQAQLEGTENRIKVARNKFNAEVSEYNKAVRRFPAKFWATIFGFSDKAMFEAQEGSQNAPKVEF
ncbi:MAG TPA: LemA family protein [Bacteroidetes bacterium]|nr:LemA family protein [Bacteroidota bacterium]